VGTIKTLLLLLLALAITWLSGCAGTPNNAKAGSVAPAFPVSVISVEARDVPVQHEHIGKTFALHTVQINSRVNGYIDRWLFRPGDLVQANQLLYVIDQRTYRAEQQRAQAEVNRNEAQLSFAKEGVEVIRAESELAQAEAMLIKANQDVERVKPLVAQRALPEQDLDAVTAAQRVARNNFKAREAIVQQSRLTQKTSIEQSAAALEAAKAALRQADLNLGFTEIRSPAAGRIGETTVQVGGLASANSPQPLTLVSPLDPIYVEFTVNERDYLTYARDLAAQGRTPKDALSRIPLQLMLADGSVYPHKGTFQFADRAVQVETGTLKLTATFPNPSGTVLPGQFSRVRMTATTKSGVFTVPQKAIQEMQGMRFVMLVGSDGVVSQRTVTATERIGSLWVIEKGLVAGDRVVVEGLQKAMPGAKVTAHVVPADGNGGSH